MSNKTKFETKGSIPIVPPADWDIWAMCRARELVKRVEEVNHPHAMFVAAIHCALIQAMEYAAAQGKIHATISAEKRIHEGWMRRFDELLEDYTGACMETAVFNATQRSGMTVRMAKPRLKKLIDHVKSAFRVCADSPQVCDLQDTEGGSTD